MTAPCGPAAGPHQWHINDGALFALKLVAVILMTVSHANKYLFGDSLPYLMEVGRPAMPLFAAVLAYNLARPGAVERGVHARTFKRLTLSGAVSSVPFMALGPVAFGWWPLNVMFTLAVATLFIWLIDIGGVARNVAAAVVFLVGGALVEFCWPALGVVWACWLFARRSTIWNAGLLVTTFALLHIPNGNHWGLAALPLLAATRFIRLPQQRSGRAFYAYYPAHLFALWAVRLTVRGLV